MACKSVSRFLSVVLCVFAGLAAIPANAQSTASLSGIVQDSSGSVIVGARVALRSGSGTEIARAVSDSAGRFTLRTEPLAGLTLVIEAKGFRTFVQQVGAGISPSVCTLQIASEEQTVTVREQAGYAVENASTGTKMDLPLMQTPVSIQVISRQVLDDQQIVNLTDAVVNVSGVAPTNDSFGTSDSFSVRGYDGAALIFQDGARMDQYSDSGFPQDMANVEKVEVMKGPASVLYGQGEPGGLVNVVTKKPQAGSFATLAQQFGPHNYFRSTADGNLPLIGEQLMSRFVFDWTDAQSFRKFGFMKELAIYPSLAWNLKKRAELVLRTSYQRGGLLLDPGIPFLSPQSGTSGSRIIAVSGPAKLPLSSNFIDIGSNDGTGWQYDIRPELTVHLGKDTDFRVSYKYFYTSADPNPPISETYFGDASIPGTPEGSLGRFGFTETYFHHRTNQVIADVPVQFKVAGIPNKLLLGFDFSKDYGAYDYNGACPQSINIYAPIYDQPIDYSPNCWLYGYGWNTLGYLAEGAYFQDFAELPHHFFVMGGVRMNWAEGFEDYFFPDPSQDFKTDVHDRPTNPRAGLLWQPVSKVSLYGNYSSNYGDSGPAVTIGVAGQKFLPPQSADQVEFGIKTEWLDRKLTASAAVYRIIKHNVPAPDPKNPLITIAIGTARTEGVEFDIAGQVTRDLRVIASFSNLQDLITRDTNSLETSGYPNQQGLPFSGIPRVTGGVWATWEPHGGSFRGLTLGGGVNGHSGEHWFQYVSLPTDVNNPTGCMDSPGDPTVCATGFEDDRMAGSALVNLMTGYHHDWDRRRLAVQLNVRNLFNDHSISSLGYEGALPNTPLQIMPQIEFKF